MQHPIDFVIRTATADTATKVRKYAERRLSFALRRFEHAIRRVKVRLTDLNGPRRGEDARCSMAVELTDGRRIVVEATTAVPFASVTQAASRLNRVLARELQLLRSSRTDHSRVH
jgi:putative sigma-54 modulation protein